MPRQSQAQHGPWPMAVESPKWGWPWLKIDLFSVVVLLLYSPLAFVVAWALALLISSAASSFCTNIKRWYRSKFVSSINGLLGTQFWFSYMTRGGDNWPRERALLAFLDKCTLHLRLCRLCRVCQILLMVFSTLQPLLHALYLSFHSTTFSLSFSFSLSYLRFTFTVFKLFLVSNYISSSSRLFFWLLHISFCMYLVLLPSMFL